MFVFSFVCLFSFYMPTYMLQQLATWNCSGADLAPEGQPLSWSPLANLEGGDLVGWSPFDNTHSTQAHRARAGPPSAPRPLTGPFRAWGKSPAGSLPITGASGCRLFPSGPAGLTL